MNRKELLQYLIDKFGYEHYLEIGVHKGKTFLPIRCRKKIAVDPSFRIHPIHLIRSIIRNHTNLWNRYYQMTSERFFRKKLSGFKIENYPDLVFIDGLHTFKASLEDVLNSLKYLKSGGSIVLHDCFPPTKAAATPARSLAEAANKEVEGWKGTWCGDVWKTIVYLKMRYPATLDIYVLNADMGLGVVRLKGNDVLEKNIEPKLFSKVDSMSYKDLVENPESLINLCELHQYSKI